MNVVELVSAKCWFTSGYGLLKPKRVARAVDGVSLAVDQNQVVGLVGESGSGKTTVGRMLLRILKPTAGTAMFRGTDMARLEGDQLRAYNRSVQAVFQDPASSLNPRMRIRDIVAEPLLLRGESRREAYSKVAASLDRVGLSADAMSKFPHEFSGGQRQRVAIARAVSASPSLIVLDEPVASLDVSIRGQVINLLNGLRREMEISYLLISHDLATTRYLSDQLYVMYAGQIVEAGPAGRICDAPAHPYTKALLSSAAHDHSERETRPPVVDGEPPDPANPPTGCRFHPRCPSAMQGCAIQVPAMTVHDGRQVACHLYSDQLQAGERQPLGLLTTPPHGPFSYEPLN
jgi:oligopeptide/dipeptide ABC transporter ATP-binding protein